MSKDERPKLADVARHAGVSAATASRVLQNNGPVSEDLRKRIEESAAALGYTPRRTAKPSAQGTIAVLTGDLTNPFFPEIVRGVQDEVDNYDMTLTLYNMTMHPHRQQQVMEKLSRQQVDGVIIMGAAAFPDLLAWRDREKIPVVVINSRRSLPGVHGILVDLENAVARAAQHLLNLGHVRIGYLASFSQSESALARRKGLEAALAAAGLSLPAELCVVFPPGVEADAGFHSMSTLLDLAAAKRPTAVLAFNDVVALGALHAIRTRGLRVPEDISVIGVDDIFVAAHAHPPLTTISQPKYQMGRLAVQTIVRMCHGQTNLGGSSTVLESPLIVRESTGPVPQAEQA